MDEPLDIIRIKHISLNGTSSLNILSDICAICREHVCNKCAKCANNNNTNTTDDISCISVLGECNHAYHNCCIQRWTNGLASIRQKCPMCNSNWVLKKRCIKFNK